MSCYFESDRDAPQPAEVDEHEDELEPSSVELEPHLERAIELATD